MKSLDLGFLILFLRKAGLPLELLQQRLRTRTFHVSLQVYFCSGHTYTVHIYSARRLPVLQSVGEVFSRVSPDRCCRVGIPLLQVGAGVGCIHSLHSRMLTQARTHMHTQTATQFNVLPLQILSINKQLEKQ